MQNSTIIDKIRDDSCVLNPESKSILLVTIYGNKNYGNVLQRYALTKLLESFGFEVTHLCLRRKGFIGSIKRIIKYLFALFGVKKFRKQFHERVVTAPREKRFKSFQDKFTKIKMFMSYGEILRKNKTYWDKYCFAVTGSDQVWHIWGHTKKEAECFYLEFIERKKRVNYAPSFGFSKFPEKDRNLHKKGLEGFDRISCREKEMQGLIRELTGQEAQLVLDPTLLLNSEQWREISSKPEYDVPKRYVLIYFLGKITSEYSQVIRDMAGALPIINVHDSNDMIHYVTHPGEFLYLVEHADFICTDSFHGTVFSAIFNKNFLTFRRKQENKVMEDMFGRIESILENLAIMNHVCNSDIKAKPDEIDYVSVMEKLDVLRESSMKYLRECLKVHN